MMVLDGFLKNGQAKTLVLPLVVALRLAALVVALWLAALVVALLVAVQGYLAAEVALLVAVLVELGAVATLAVHTSAHAEEAKDAVANGIPDAAVAKQVYVP
eukprot:CAMPEP_0169237480 /NCGR_PEP_ID=MMETSP1016-20121227/29829_1 /TAXON_ID=342587 /ORGANISM="Karlodinium micrum, Strain CCMP2283" /LENGTH=101 /DNA_ID=CAMNT_0009317207 /DNA_START=432 /DNA_END=737 /DNA_ORIENTATION=+